MFIITEKLQNIILMFGEQLDYLSNGYPRLIDKNIAFPTESVNVFEVDNIADNICPHKYCYTTEKGFFENLNYVSPEEAMKKSSLYQMGYNQAIIDFQNE